MATGPETYEKSAGGVILPNGHKSSNVPKMQNRAPLKAEKDKVRSKKDNFFWAVWVFLSATTAFFGFQHLPEIFAPMLEWMPISPGGIYRMAQWAGAIMGLLFLDVGYMRWGYIRLNASETARQIAIATLAEWVAFVGSVYFTGAVIASAFVNLLPAQFIQGLQVGGAVIFIASAIVTMICRFLFDRYSVEATQKAHDANNKGNETTEILDLYKRAKEQALIEASQKMEDQLSGISSSIAEGLAKEISGEMTGIFQVPTVENDAPIPPPNRGR